MATHFANDLSSFNDQLLSFRPSKQVMSLERMGAYHQSRLSFMRCLIRRIFSQQWDINMSLCELDTQGYGTVIYTIKAPGGVYSFVVFSNYLADEQRNDRVIATQWDLTMALVEGTVSQDYLSMLKENVPKQEAGRVDSRVFVLSRANRSARNFNYVVKQLAQGKQPDINKITKVGYLYRTTACYGSGKLGMADWEKVKNKYTDFARPFAAEMFACFMIRNFSFFQAQYIAKQHSPDTFKPMDLNIKRYIGIGNSTGLGMAPFLVNHPLLINQWVEMRELALARIRQKGEIDLRIQKAFNRLLQRCVEHIKETHTEDDWQSNNNQTVLADLQKLKSQTIKPIHSWDTLIQFSEQHFSLQAQELLVSLMLELYPEHVDDLEDRLDVEETMHLNPAMPLTDLIAIIKNKYQWALDIDFNHPDAKQTCWYRSEQKMEPRLGSSSDPEGKKKQMALGVGYAVRKCYEQLTRYHIEHNHHTTASFLIKFPKLRGIVRRIQTMNNCIYGDIQANLLDKHVLPIHLLRAKLAFFGVSKFDPRSRLWVRNTMFQGAPLLEDIGTPFNDDWFMPMAPK